MKSERSVTVISLGGRVQFPDRSRGQASVMALIAGESLSPTGSGGAFDGVPDCAIFADTHWELPSVYEHIKWLKVQLRFPDYVVDNSLTRARHGGRSLREDVKALTNHSGSCNYVDIPHYLKGRDGVSKGIGRRQCTTNYKVIPILRKIRELLGLRKGQRVPSATTVELRLGISTDEAVRMKDSRYRWIWNRYPLIQAGMSRQDCIDWWGSRYDRPLERSAPDRVVGRLCVACPFESSQRWVETKRRACPRPDRRWPQLFAEAVEIDARMRDGLTFAKEPYLHSSRKPLDQAVALDEADMEAEGQRVRFGSECEGQCGL